MAPFQVLAGEWRYGNHLRLEIFQCRTQPLEIRSLGENHQVGVAAKLPLRETIAKRRCTTFHSALNHISYFGE